MNGFIFIEIVLPTLVVDLVADGVSTEVALHGFIVVVDTMCCLEAHGFALEPAFQALVMHIFDRTWAVTDVEEGVGAWVTGIEADSARLLLDTDSTFGHTIEQEVRLLHAEHTAFFHVSFLVLPIKAAVLQNI